MLGKPFYLDIERLFTDAPVCQHAVIEKNGDGIAGKAFHQSDVVGFGKVAFALFLPLQAHAHVDEDNDNEYYGKSKDAVAYHKLFVGIQVMYHDD